MNVCIKVSIKVSCYSNFCDAYDLLQHDNISKHNILEAVCVCMCVYDGVRGGGLCTL